MRDRFIAIVQAALTFLLVGSFIYLLASGKADAATAMKDFTGMAVMFWLMRHRQATSSSADDSSGTTTTTTTTSTTPTSRPPATASTGGEAAALDPRSPATG